VLKEGCARAGCGSAFGRAVLARRSASGRWGRCQRRRV